MASYLGLGGSNADKPIIYGGLNVSTSLRDVPIPIFGGTRRLPTNCIWYNNFKKHSVGGGIFGSGGGGKGGQYDYTAAVCLAYSEGPVDSINLVWSAASATALTTLSDLGFSFNSGTASQAPESWIVTEYPTQAESYAYTSYFFDENLDLGSSAQVPDNQFEGQRTSMYSYVHSTPGYIDPTVEPPYQYTGYDILMSDWITDWLTNPQYGMGFASGDLSSMTQFRNQLLAYGIFHSPLLNSQEKGTQVLDRYAQSSYAWIYYDGLQIQFFPLGDTVVTGNATTFTPQNDVAYVLTPGDFKEPIKVTRKAPIDCYNRTLLDLVDRTLGYVSNPLEYRDDTLVDLYGLRDAPSIQGNDICDPLVGQIVVNLCGVRTANIRNTYQWKSSYRLILCLPGTILALNEPNIGLSNFLVRVTKISQDDKELIEIEAEEYPGTMGTLPTTLPAVTTTSTGPPNATTPSGNVNTPMIAEPDSSFTGGVPRLYVAASGGANFGGCQVWISFDNLNYAMIDPINASAPQGVLTAALASHADPDLIDTLSVDMTESLTVLPPFTTGAADAYRTLSMICAQPTLSGGVYVVPTNGELLAPGTTATTGTYTANLTYLRRGLYGTAPASHSIGDQFTMIDVSLSQGTTVAYDLPPQYIGQPIYVKLAALNQFDRSAQDLSSLTAYSYTPTGLGYGTAAGGVPATPTGLAVASGVQSAVVSWLANAAADNVLSYNVYRAPGTGASFGSASIVQNISALGWDDNTLAANTGSTYFLTAVNAAGESGHTSGVSVTTATTVVNQFGFGFDRDVSFGTLGQSLVEFTVNFPWTLIAGMATSEVKITGTGPTTSTSFPIYVNGVNVGSIDFATSATTATFTKASNTNVAAGQTTQVYLPSNLNGMTGRLFGSVVGTR